MSFDHYIQAGGRRLRCGYTTQRSTVLAAQGAAHLLLTGRAPERVSLRTPQGLGGGGPRWRTPGWRGGRPPAR